MGIETVLQAQQDVPRLPPLAPPGHVPEVAEPMAIHAAAGQVGAIPITPPLHRDLSAVVAAGHPPTGPAQALLDLLAAGLPGDIH
jgi:hypothetical protein